MLWWLWWRKLFRRLFRPENLLRLPQLQGLLEPEVEDSLRGDFDLMSPGQNLNASTGNRTRNRADGSTLTAAGQRTQQGSESRAPAHHFASALIGADPSAASRANAGRVHQVSPAIDAHRVQV